MVVKVIWTGPAHRQLRELSGYYKKVASVRTANKIRDKIYSRVDILETNPRAGQCEDLLAYDGREFRYLVEGNYKIVYWVEPERVFISAVFDCRQNPEKMKEEVAGKTERYSVRGA